MPFRPTSMPGRAKLSIVLTRSSSAVSGSVPGHIPVLLSEAVDALNVRPGGVYVDGTFGAGGHTREILARDETASVIAFDRDLAAIPRAEALATEVGPDRFTFVHASFADLGEVLDSHGRSTVDGVLLDLGVSSFQFDQAERGFSFRFEGPLDMRFDTSTGESAADLLATRDEAEIADILWTYGEERRSRQIARAVVQRRDREPITTTSDLAALVERVVGRGKSGHHPATRTFQALRIAVNGELDALEAVLPVAVERLSQGGRISIISFHSLEDRIVKQFIAREVSPCICPPEQPVCTCGKVARLRRVGAKIRPSTGEQHDNVRSRSAILRVAERI
ncbi:MAG: 16S rRNA (cytosine(1402)-N(4))-methyltransferase RsmH [Chloroflexota bacterium]|nr:16S rRNA (cytosine(1402)-N(4))-methyltransferase RsmH [Chloroflexota bacterium]